MKDIQEIFKAQSQHQYTLGNSSASQRISRLNALQKAVEKTYRKDLQEALFKDFKKPAIETDLTEIHPVISEIKLIKKQLKSWMLPLRVKTPFVFIGSSSYVIQEPKGVCLIISPWNFPVNLTFGPLASAIAAGNTVIIKPSEMTPHTAAVMAEIVSAVFKPEEVSLFEGDATVAQSLLSLPFNHIFFTGSPTVGKIVMGAAAKHLSSVTLELGGKSPTIVDASANIDQAAKRIAWGKFLNNGQICVAPDYLLIEHSIKEAFIIAFIKYTKHFYSEQVSKSEDYGRIVNQKHFERLLAHLEDAKKNGGTIEMGGDFIASENYISPTLISGLTADATLLKDEIFGPILPLKTFKKIEEVIDYINAGEKPLALYLFSKKPAIIKQVLRNTRAGSTAINHSVVQYSNHHLPFGGSNNSGIGKAHGYYGFQEFSNQRSVVKQFSFSAVEMLMPPYTSLKKRLSEWTTKWF
ncbi:aldehyde dehydrogenase family protein [Flavobacteriaceae bacterium]|nr:aldehyde dehydrogenase family protein [Flavobacteriaceae bacterium]MDB9903696.1 aldehyde dehydrogenase family protein [Flavobacteriaceae bacterium]